MNHTIIYYFIWESYPQYSTVAVANVRYNVVQPINMDLYILTYMVIVTGPISHGHLDHKTIEQLQPGECIAQLCK